MAGFDSWEKPDFDELWDVYTEFLHFREMQFPIQSAIDAADTKGAKVVGYRVNSDGTASVLLRRKGSQTRGDGPDFDTALRAAVEKIGE